MQAFFLFTPGGANDPLPISLPNGANIHGIWVPAPTNPISFQQPISSGGWSTFYQITQPSAESIPLDDAGYANLRVISDGSGGAPFYIIIMDEYLSPFKAPPSIVIPALIDLSALSIFNYQFYGGLANASPAVNDSALTDMFAAMQALNGGNGGGWGWFPAGTFPVNAGSFDPSDQSVLQGAGAAQNNGPGSATFSVQTPGRFWDITGPHTNGGLTILDLAFGCTNAAQDPSSIAIRANVYHTIIERCIFQDWPTALSIPGGNSGARACTITYNGTVNGGSDYFSAQPMVYLGAPETFIESTSILQTGNQTGIAAISVGGQPCEHPHANDCHLANTDYGIVYSLANGAAHLGSYTGNEIQSNVTGIVMVPAGSMFSIYGERHNDFTCSQSNGASSVTPGIICDTNAGISANVDDNEFNNGRVFQWLSHGYQFAHGQNYRINGGCSAGNAGYGIAVVGPLGLAGTPALTVTGTNLSQTYPNAHTPQTQLGALLVSGLLIPGVIKLVGCPMLGYSGNPVVVTGTFSFGNGKLYINLCEGYNDNPVCWSGLPLTIPTSSTTAAANNFYGPTGIDLTASSTTVVSLNGVNYTILNGQTWSRTIGPWDTFFKVSGSVSAFGWQGVWG